MVPVIKILSPNHKDNKESENSLTSVARSAAMLAMATPLLSERLTQQQRPTSFTNKERQVSLVRLGVCRSLFWSDLLQNLFLNKLSYNKQTI